MRGSTLDRPSNARYTIFGLLGSNSALEADRVMNNWQTNFFSSVHIQAATYFEPLNQSVQFLSVNCSLGH